MQPCSALSFSAKLFSTLSTTHHPTRHIVPSNSKLKCNLLASDKVAPLLFLSVNSNILKDDAMQSIFIVFAFRGWGSGRSSAVHSRFLFCFMLPYLTSLLTLFRATWWTHTTAHSFQFNHIAQHSSSWSMTTKHFSIAFRVQSRLAEYWCTIRWI